MSQTEFERGFIAGVNATKKQVVIDIMYSDVQLPPKEEKEAQ